MSEGLLTKEEKERILRTIETDREFRLAIAGAIGLKEILERLERIEKRLEEHDKILADHSKRIEELSRAIMEQSRRIEELSRAVIEQSRRIDNLERSLMALGNRWGLVSEEAFRNAMKGIVEEILNVRKVERWIYFDSEGYVYGHPSVVEADLVIKGNEHIIVEIKSSVDTGDILELKRIGELYEKVKGVRPTLVVIAPSIKSKALKLAEEVGIRVYSSRT